MTTLLFQVDQGTAGGPAANFGPGKPGGPFLPRMWESLAPLRPRYDVVLGLAPIHPDFGNVIAPLLETLAVSYGAKYCLDVMSSDNIAMGIAPWRAPYDVAHGVSLSIQRVQWLRQRHGPLFAGLRSHEACTMSWIIEQCRHGALDWWTAFADLAPVPGVFLHPELLDPFLSFAQGSGMWVCYSEPHWDAATVATLQAAVAAHPGCIIPTFANNMVNMSGPSQLDTYWPAYLQQFAGRPAKGWGLSDQAWAWDGTGHAADDAALARWAAQAVQTGAALVEFEPAGYLWNVPIVWEPLTPQHDASPLPALEKLIAALLAA